MDQPQKSKTPCWMIAVAWTVVTIPLGWGVYQSVVKSLPLFEGSAAAKSAPSAAK